MARSGMRVGEVLKLTPNDILDRKLLLNDTKGGNEQDVLTLSLYKFLSATAVWLGISTICQRASCAQINQTRTALRLSALT